MIGCHRLRRRAFLTATIAVVGPGPARAQQADKVHRIAILSPATPASEMTKSGTPVWRGFFAELQRLGYIEGQNLTIERASAEGKPEHLVPLAQALAESKPNVIFATDIRGALALKAATSTIPVVVATPDPVRAGLVASLARPGANITGFSIDAGLELIGKRIELLKQAVPTASRMAFLTPRQAGESRFPSDFKEAARLARVVMVEAPLHSPIAEETYRLAFAAMREQRVDSVYVVPNTENYVYRRLIAALAAEARLPAIHPFRESAEAGGLMAYAFDIVDIWRRIAGYIDRILKGARPADMPFQQPTRFELIVNLKSAAALGLTIPPAILARADEVIE